MSRTLYTRTAFGRIDDLDTTTLSPIYRLGERVDVFDTPTIFTDDNIIAQYIYIKATIALTQFQPYVLNFSEVKDAEYFAAPPFTFNPIGLNVIIPQIAFLVDTFGFVLIKGNGQSLVAAEPYTTGDHMQLLNAGTTLVVDGGTGLTVLTPESTAIIKETGVTAVDRSIILLGQRSNIAGA